jgi:hypothetical protein
MGTVMKHLARASLIAAALMLSGCPKPWALNLLNNTSQAVVLRSDSGGTQVWQAHSVVRLRYGEGFIVQVPAGTAGTSYPYLKTEQGGRARDYSLIHDVPDDYVKDEGTGEFYLILQPDEKLYAVRPGEFMAPHDPGTPPSAYPIAPANH